ncbi:hypothetical protein C7M84_006864 [Penaeus vannamei]|uniref:GOST seven transmembrane domain-containing protein n=1 Tax=Penaeus vannamei TaxID=6689 RepID=A0A423TE03_PENVA|nr:hypothetical protein C7M84_006864 [Penaeus vannamei]
MLRKTPCWNEYVIPEDGKDSVLQNYFNHPSQFLLQSQDGKAYEPGYVKTDPKIVNCDDIIVLDEVDLEKKLVMKSDADAEEAHLEAARAVSGDTAATSEIAPVVKSGLSESDISAGGAAQTKHPVAILPFDGVYLLVVHTAAVPESVIGNDSYIAEIDIEMRSDYGYLSAVEALGRRARAGLRGSEGGGDRARAGRAQGGQAGRGGNDAEGKTARAQAGRRGRRGEGTGTQGKRWGAEGRGRARGSAAAGYHQFEKCLTDWKELWVDDAYWHVLFAVVLLVIMILWRPSNNNQRFAFSPLLDDGSDADDEEEAEKLMADISDTMKFRNTRNSTSSSPRESRSVEDDLKWVEENIPSSIADSALPILDSDEEIVTSKFEISKMQ